MRKTVAIIQARISSTRLPGKVLMDLAGKTVLRHVLDRCAAIPVVDAVCCAIPVGSIHDAIAVEAKTAGVSIYRGSETDVLDRYWRAAEQFNATTILRVTSDCPFVDPLLCDRVAKEVISGRADYGCNNMPPTWPHGLDCEAFTMDALRRAGQEAVEPYDREHVTPWLRESPVIRRANVAGPGGWAAQQRWTLDFPEDLEFLRHALRIVPVGFSTECLLDALSLRPDIIALNSRYHNVSRPVVPNLKQECQ